MHAARSLYFAVALSACSAQEQPATAAPGTEPTVAFTVAERDLLPENVAYDPTDSSFYMGSTRKGKIVRIRPDGSTSDFVGPRQDGLWMVIGMKVDPVRRVLWVCSSAGDNLEPSDVGNDGKSAGVFQFDLTTGRLLAKLAFAGDDATHFFNDLVLSESGDAYVTHMFAEPVVYRIRAGSNILERLASLPAESYPNGITIDERGRLIVATSRGLVAIDTGTAVVSTLETAAGVNTRGIDGLYARGDQLIAVRPDANEVRSYRMNAAMDSVLSSEVLIANHPSFSNPTTGVLVDDALYMVANSHFQRVGPGGAIPDSLDAPVVLRVTLK